MSNPITVLADKRNPIIQKLLDFAPDIPHRTAARLLYEQHPDLFKSVEVARRAIQTRTGNNGLGHRNELQNKHGKNYREPFTGSALPVPAVLEDDSPFHFDTENLFILGDVHVPFHETEPIELAVKTAKKHGCKDVLVLGDFHDHYQLSEFCKVPGVGMLKESLDKGTAMWQWLRKQFPKGRIVFKYGNHDERWEIKAHRSMPEIGTLLDHVWESYQGLPELGIEVVKERRFIYLGKYLTAFHGHELGKGIYNPVSPARTAGLRFKENCIVAHSHQSTTQRGKTGRGKQLGFFSIGCLCKLNPQFSRINEWQHGFAMLDRLDTEGNFIMHNKIIINRMVV